LPPVAQLIVTPSTGLAPLPVVASAVGSSDSDGSIASYRFDFGDGTVVGPQSLPTAAHTYAAGRWTCTVTVTDNAGATATASVAVTATLLGLGANVVSNPSFESDTTGWVPVGGSEMQRVSGGYDGRYSLEMRHSGSGIARFAVTSQPVVNSTGAPGPGTMVALRPGPDPGEQPAPRVVPNPVRTDARLTLSISRPGPLGVRIFDPGGRLVRTLREEMPATGSQVVAFDGRADDEAP